MSKRIAPKVEDWEARLGTTAFDPLEAMQFVDAVKNRETSLNLGTRSFALVYRDDKVFYTPIQGFVPCGWLDISRVERGW